MESFDVVGIGANSVDYVYLLPAYPQQHGPFAKMRIRRQLQSCGGQMATAMATCVQFGLRARYVGVTGTDENGRRIRAELLDRGVDLTGAIVRDAGNQFAVIIVDESSGERIVLWDRDERLLLRERELPMETLAAARLIHVDDVDQPAALRAACFARERGIPTTSDLDRTTDLTEALVAAVAIPMFAEHLTTELTGESDQERALRKLRRRHDGVLVVTLGAQGVMALEDDRLHFVPGLSVDAIDTTGAGDVFRGGFIYGYSRGWPIEQVVRFANAAAAVSCTRLGAMNGVPSLDEVHRLLEGKCE
jgi:sugar/nucleoside kinase (ribokinase family)